MPEDYGITMEAGVGGREQLHARNGDVKTMPATVDTAGGVYKRGCLVFAATPDAAFAKVLTAALPAATDLVGIVLTEVDATAADQKTVVAVGGEFVADTVWRNSGVIDAAGKLAAREACLHQGINLVNSAYGDATGSL